jgi:hypothetical protein
VSVTKRYETTADEMWERIGDPGALAARHPAVESTELMDGGTARVNTLRGFFQDGLDAL